MKHKMSNRTSTKIDCGLSIESTGPSSSASLLHSGWWLAPLRSRAKRWLHLKPNQQPADKETDLLRAEDGFVSARLIRTHRFLRLF